MTDRNHGLRLRRCQPSQLVVRVVPGGGCDASTRCWWRGGAIARSPWWCKVRDVDNPLQGGAAKQLGAARTELNRRILGGGTR